MTAAEEDQKFELLIQQIAPQSRLLRTWPLTGGISAEMTALEIERPDGQTRKMIVRRPGAGTLQRNPQAAQNEYTLLQRMQSLGLATPTPYHLDSSGAIFATPYLVLEYIEGTPEFAPRQIDDYLLQFATHLAQIHQIEDSKLDLSFLPEHAGRCEETSGDFSLLKDSALGMERLRERMDGFHLPLHRNPPVLLHGDYWPGNVLWQEESLVAVIDWEDARVGDPLTDFAISRLDILCIFGIVALHAFTHYYQSRMALDYTDLPYWDLCAALRLIRLSGSDLADWAAFYPPVGRPDITEQTLKEHLRFFLTQALEKTR
jgi:aminoglycoside phosphotransferase (APT) family kinase protein